MSVARDIVASWRRPAQVMRRLLDMGRREDRALMFLMLGCALIFVSQWPLISRQAALDPDGAPLQARLAITFFAWLMVWPIGFYGIGSLTHLIARAFGGRGTWYSARLALFWALLASSPGWLFYGLVAGFVGPGSAQQVTGALLLLAFLTIWGICLRVAETVPEAETPR
jgi:hypothetical protein